MSDGFVLVTKSKSKNKKLRKSNQIQLDRPLSPADIDEEKVLRKIQDIKIDLKSSDFFEKAVELLVKSLENRKIQEIVCLGIGKVTECIIAKHQLAFILIVKEKFNIQRAKFYDPVLLSSDKEVLKSLDCEILTENKEGKYKATHPTLFYLPHCPKQITNNLLYTNWTAKELGNLVLICNSFKSIVESTPERFLRPNAHYLLEINPFVDEQEIANCFKFTDIFNDFSIHTFSSAKLARAGEDFWKVGKEPVYSAEDLEFVKDGCHQDSERNSQ